MKMRDVPCKQCGWRYPGFHVCVDLSKPIDTKISNRHIQAHNQKISQSHLDALQRGKTERWERHRDETANRDAKIVALYRAGDGMKPLAKDFSIAFQTIRGILKRAEDRGEVTIRPRGYNGQHKEASTDVREEETT